MPKKYFIFYPHKRGSISEEWIQCLSQIKNTITKTCKPVKINVFTDILDNDILIETRKSIIEIASVQLNSELPAISVTVHPPGKPWKIVVEALFIENDFCAVQADVCCNNLLTEIEAELVLEF